MTVENHGQSSRVWELLGFVTVTLPWLTVGVVTITEAKGAEALMSMALAFVPGAVWVIDILARGFIKLIKTQG